MIASLRGQVASRSPEGVIVDVGGVGYLVHVSHHSLMALPQVGGPAFVEVVTHVREDTLALFGFVVPGEKPVFKLLCEISGIGPRMALTILSGITPQELVSAVMGENTTRLQKIPGVGKRLAGRMIVELKDKLAKGDAGLPEMPEIPSAPEAASAPGVVDDLAMALGALGYSKAEIDRITRKVVADAPEEDRVEVLLKAALRELNPLRAGGRP